MANQHSASNSWPDERVEFLKRLWSEGKTAAQIAALIGGKITRNSVLGKAHRLGIVVKGLRTAHYGKSRKSRTGWSSNSLERAICGNRVHKLKSGPTAHANPNLVREIGTPKADDVARKTLLELDDQDCRFIVGEPSGIAKCFCALPQIAGSKYCLTHFIRTHEAPKLRPNLNLVADTSAPVKEGADA